MSSASSASGAISKERFWKAIRSPVDTLLIRVGVEIGTIVRVRENTNPLHIRRDVVIV